MQVLPCGFVVDYNCPILGATPDARVIDLGCTDHYGIVEVKCPKSKFHVTPLEASTDPSFFMEKINENQCTLKKNDKYYFQVQGQMGVTGVPWCDFVVYTDLGLYIQRISFDSQFWEDLKEKLISCYFKNFIKFASNEWLKDQTSDSVQADECCAL